MNGLVATTLVRLTAEFVLTTGDLLQAIGAGKGLRPKIAKRHSALLEEVFSRIDDEVTEKTKGLATIAPIGWERVERRVNEARSELHKATAACDFDLDEYLANRGK